LNTNINVFNNEKNVHGITLTL